MILKLVDTIQMSNPQVEVDCKTVELQVSNDLQVFRSLKHVSNNK